MGQHGWGKKSLLSALPEKCKSYTTYRAKVDSARKVRWYTSRTMSNYDFTPQAKEEIWAAIRKRKPNIECPVCHFQDHWEMAEGFVTLPLLSNFWKETRISSLPSVALVCEKCGNTLLFNLMMLGLRHLVGPDLDKITRRLGGG